jgi:hypothetical protein
MSRATLAHDVSELSIYVEQAIVKKKSVFREARFWKKAAQGH